MQVMFVAPARSREQALQLAAKAKALTVRPHVLARWARFLVEQGQSNLFPELHGEQQSVPQPPAAVPPGLNQGMLEWCDRHPAGAAVVPPQALQGAVHTNSNEQARIVLHMFNRGREGYASTRAGHADDPNAGDATAPLADWELPEDEEQPAGESRRAGGV